MHGEDTLRIQLEEAAKNSKEIRRFVKIMFPEKQVDPDDEYMLSKLNEIEIDYDDRNGWHAIVMDITHSSDVGMPDSLLVWAYENSLCSCCREDVVSKMIERNVFPRYYRLECMHDSNLDIRELAKTVVEDEVTDKG